MIWNNLSPSRSSSSCSRKSPAGPGRPVWVSRGSTGTGPAAHRGAACRRRAHGTDSGSSCAVDGGPIGGFTLAPRQADSQAGNRSAQNLVVIPVVLARLSGSRRRRSSWWKCRLSCLFLLCSSRLPARAVHTLKFGALFRRGFVSGSHMSHTLRLVVKPQRLTS